MSTEGYVKFEYFSKGVPPYYGNNTIPELLDDEKIVIETPCIEMNIHQYYGLFKRFLMSVGFEQKNIVQGACNIAFNEMNDEKTMREVAEEYDLTMNEDLPGILEDRIRQEKEWIERIENEKKVNDTMPPWGHSDMEALKYTEEELNAMCDKAASDNEKEKCQEYNLREAEFYNMRAMVDADSLLTKDRDSNFPSENTIEDTSNTDMWDQGVMKVTTNDPMKVWNGLIPGSPEARAQGCICPVLDNEDMPDDKKWIDVECPIHGRKG